MQCHPYQIDWLQAGIMYAKVRDEMTVSYHFTASCRNDMVEKPGIFCDILNPGRKATPARSVNTFGTI